VYQEDPLKKIDFLENQIMQISTQLLEIANAVCGNLIEQLQQEKKAKKQVE